MERTGHRVPNSIGGETTTPVVVCTSLSLLPVCYSSQPDVPFASPLCRCSCNLISQACSAVALALLCSNSWRASSSISNWQQARCAAWDARQGNVHHLSFKSKQAGRCGCTNQLDGVQLLGSREGWGSLRVLTGSWPH